jgi:hypothetical protein
MRHAKHFLRIAGAIIITCGVIAGAACGDDEVTPLSLEAYFARVEAIEQDADRHMEPWRRLLADELEAETAELFAGDVTLDDETLDSTQEVYRRFAEIVDEFVADMRFLDPPAEALDAHDAYVVAIEDLGDAFGDLADSIDDVDSVDAARDLLGVADPPDDEAEAACVRLESIALKNGIQANLECGSDD